MSELYRKFGDLLKLERKRKGIKLEELSEQLKISETNLEFIEEGQVTSLPSMIYFNLFAKAYAEALGIDYSRTVDAIKEDIGESVENNGAIKDTTISNISKEKTPKPNGKAKASEKTDDSAASIKKLLYMFGVIVVMFIIFIAIYLFFFASDVGDKSQKQSPPDSVAVTSVASEQPDETMDSLEIDWTISDYEAPRKISLKLTSRQQSWSTVLADGDTAIFRNLIPGRVYEAEANYRMTVSVGIPSQVDIELNGQKVDLRDSETGRVSRVEITQLNLDEILARGTDTTSGPVVSSRTSVRAPEQTPVSPDSANLTGTDRDDDD